MSLQPTKSAFWGLLLLFLVGLSLPGLAQQPSVINVSPDPNTIFTTVDTYCAGGTIGVSFSDILNGGAYDATLNPNIYNADNRYVLQLSDANGSFASPTIIATSSNVTAQHRQASNQKLSGPIPATIAIGYGYKVRVSTTSPVTNGGAFNTNLTILGISPQPDFGGNVTVAQNSTFSLTNTAPCPVTLTWGRTNGDMAIGFGSTINVPTAQLGVVSYTAVCGGGQRCKSSANVFIVTVVAVSPTPPTNLSLTSGTLTCAQTSLPLTATSTGGTSYSLSNGQTNTTGLFTVNAPGTYTLTVANATGQTAFTTTTIASDVNGPIVTITPTSGTLTCSQPSLTLTATSSATVRWTGNVLSSSLVVNTSGTYSISAIGDNGCITYGSIPVASNTTAPTVGLMASNTTLTCTRTAVTLTASGGATYSFSGTGLVASSGNSATVNAANTYTVTVTGDNGCTATQTATITSNTVAVTPTLTANPNATLTCAQTSLTLTAGGGDTYSFGGPTPISQVGNALVANVTGTYSVTAINTASGCFGSTTLAVSQTNAGLITVGLTTPNTNLTTTAPTALLTATPGAGTYRFVGPGLSQTGPSNTATGSQAGVFSVTAGQGICATIASVTLTGTGGPAPAPSPFAVVLGVLSCNTPTVTIEVVSGDQFGFTDANGTQDGIVSVFDGSFRELIGEGYRLVRTPIPTLGRAVVNKPGTYIITARNGNSLPTQIQVVVTGVACP